MYEPSKTYETFTIAGFEYWDGASVLTSLRPGMQLKLVPEFDNPHDCKAIALFYHDVKLGFIPRFVNDIPAQLLFYGHEDVFEAIILAVRPEESPYKQVHVGLRIKDIRDTH